VRLLAGVGFEGGVGGGRGGRGAGGGQAAAEQELLVFAVEVEDLQRALAGAFQHVTAVFAGSGGVFAEGGQARVQAGGEGLFLLTPRGFGRTAVRFKDSVFLDAKLVKLVAEGEVAGEVVGERHEAESGGLRAKGKRMFQEMAGRAGSVIAV
jgi:hypothetical protein